MAASLIPPRLPAELAVLPNALAELRAAPPDDRELSGLGLSGLCAKGEELSKLCLREARLSGCELVGCRLQKAEFADVVFESCDFSNCDFSDAYFSRCEFRACKGVGVGMREAVLRDVQFWGGNFRYSDWNGAALRAVRFRDAALCEASFSECKAGPLGFSDCDLTRAAFFKTPLKGVDLRTNRIDGIVVSGPELKGAVVDVFQAAALARLLGVVIKD